MEIYNENQAKSNDEAISSNPLALCVIKLMSTKLEYEDTVSALMLELERIADAEHLNISDRAFPKAPNALSRKLKEIKSNLEGVGISFGIRHNGNAKVITIMKS